MILNVYTYYFLILLTVWSIFAILSKLLKLDKRGIMIYPLILVIKSQRFLRIIESEARKRPKFWDLVAKLSPVFLWLIIGVAIVYFFLNLYYLFYGIFSLRGGIPIGTPLVPIIPFITVSGKFLIYLLVASAIAIIPHEISHGVVALKNGFRIESTGFFFVLGAVFGAFVELPEEETDSLITEKKTGEIRNIIKLRNLRRILAAGVFFNVILFSAFYGLALNYDYIMSPFFERSGVKVIDVSNGSPAEQAGLSPGIVIVKINETEIKDVDSFLRYMANVSPGDMLIVYSINGDLYKVRVGHSENDPNKPYLGVIITNYHRSRVPLISDEFYTEFFTFIYISMLLQFIIIITNALPIFISDGAKFLLAFLREKINNKGIADLMYISINWLCLIILLANFILPLAK